MLKVKEIELLEE